MKTSLEIITEVLESVGKTCDGWGPEEFCGNEPKWAVTTRHSSPLVPGCAPQISLLCEAHRLCMYQFLARMAMSVWSCANCGAPHLHAPKDFLLREERL